MTTSRKYYHLVEVIEVEGCITDVRSISMKREQIKRVFLRRIDVKDFTPVPQESKFIPWAGE